MAVELEMAFDRIYDNTFKITHAKVSSLELVFDFSIVIDVGIRNSTSFPR